MANEGTAPAESAASEFSLADEVGEMFGELSDVETPESTSGTTPQADSDSSVATAEGSDKEVRAETPSADATKTEPDKEGTETPSSDDDYLKDAKPFTYKTSTGEEKSIEGIKVLGESGAIVTPEGLVFINERIADAERFHTTSREQYAEIQNYEKLSEFHTKDAEGKDTVLSGAEGLLAARVQLATLAAEFETLIGALNDPAKFAELVAVDANSQIIVNQRALANLVTAAELASTRADQAARNHFASAMRPGGRQEQGNQQVDYARQAPPMIDRIAGAEAKLLSEADKKFLSEQFPRYVRTVTAEDRGRDGNLKIGQPIVDASFAVVVKDRVGIRAELAKTVKVNSQASDENARKLAAAAAGARTKTAPTTEARREDTSRETDADKAWRERERAAAASIR